MDIRSRSEVVLVVSLRAMVNELDLKSHVSFGDSCENGLKFAYSTEVAQLYCSGSKVVSWFWFSLVSGLYLVKLSTACSGSILTHLCCCKVKAMKPMALDFGLKYYLG